MKVFEVALILEQDVTSGATLNFMCVCLGVCVFMTEHYMYVSVCIFRKNW